MGCRIPTTGVNSSVKLTQVLHRIVIVGWQPSYLAPKTVTHGHHVAVIRLLRLIAVIAVDCG